MTRGVFGYFGSGRDFSLGRTCRRGTSGPGRAIETHVCRGVNVEFREVSGNMCYAVSGGSRRYVLVRKSNESLSVLKSGDVSYVLASRP